MVLEWLLDRLFAKKISKNSQNLSKISFFPQQKKSTKTYLFMGHVLICGGLEQLTSSLFANWLGKEFVPFWHVLEWDLFLLVKKFYQTEAYLVWRIEELLACQIVDEIIIAEISIAQRQVYTILNLLVKRTKVTFTLGLGAFCSLAIFIDLAVITVFFYIIAKFSNGLGSFLV